MFYDKTYYKIFRGVHFMKEKVTFLWVLVCYYSFMSGASLLFSGDQLILNETKHLQIEQCKW